MSNKKILSNTLALYFRLLVTLFVSLFTTRIVLKNLGVEDYGLYGTVAGIIALIAFLQNALSGATNRFFNVEMVKGDIKHIQKLFSTSFFLHIFIAVFICLALEIAGVFGLKYYIHIPEGKLALANNVLHLSILSLLILILTIPFEALLIAKENFKAYAFISAFETFTKLAVAYSLVFFTSERLVYYAVGLLLSTFLARSMYVLVTKHLYQEVSIRAGIDKGFSKQIFSFVSWDLYGNFAVILRVHGTTLIMNNFFGLIMVASIQIGNQVSTAVGSFSNNLLLAFRPQLMQSYIQSDMERLNELVVDAAKYSYYLFLLLCIPLIINIDFILKFWLLKPPQYVRTLIVFMLSIALINILFNPLNALIHATGNIKKISFISGTIILLSIPVNYLLLKMKLNYSIIYWNLILNTLLVGFTNLYIANSLIRDFALKKFIKYAIFNVLIVTTILASIMILISPWLTVTDLTTLIMKGTLEFCICFIIIIYLGVKSSHRVALVKLLRLKLKIGQ